MLKSQIRATQRFFAIFSNISKEPILRNFLGAENCEESDKQPSVVIKSYLKFCAVTESDVWQPTILEQWDQTFESEYYDETEDEISENEKLSDEWEDDVDNTPEVVDNDRKSRKQVIFYNQTTKSVHKVATR